MKCEMRTWVITFIDLIKSITTMKNVLLMRMIFINVLKTLFNHDILSNWVNYNVRIFTMINIYVIEKKTLTKRFKINEIETLMLLHENKYIVDDVRRQREIFNYVQNVVRHNKKTNIINVFQQLYWVWNHLNFDFQRNVIKFDRHIIVFDFIQHLKNRQLIWKRYYVKKKFEKVMKVTSNINFIFVVISTTILTTIILTTTLSINQSKLLTRSTIQ